MEAYSLQGGYTGWLLNLMQKEQPGEKENERAREIEKSIRKKFHKVLFSRFAKAINEYDMIQENDKIAVCISGGKDSMLMAKLFQELKRHNKFPFELVFLVMDPGYSEANRKIIENNAKLMDIPITIFESQIASAHSRTQIAGRILDIIHCVKYLGFKNCDGNVHQLRIVLDNLTVRLTVTGIHH
jgi:3'-phosphoadenosine 5'-phosphosulfate sulfotransferase (PAPS reductase)/FAD synthetase